MILQTENLCKSFGGIQASSEVNLEVEEHQVHAIVGPNGAGKTTLVSQLSGMLKPDSGRILFKGQDITSLEMHRRVHLGLVRSFQVTSIILPMTLMENVLLGVQSCSGHSYSFWNPAVSETVNGDLAREILDRVGLTGRGDTLASAVSHGEQRQLEIAMALALKPDMLLLDEPTAGMSKEESLKMTRLLESLKQDTTILLIEHDMDTVFALADRTSVLVNGQIIASGTNEEIRNDSQVQAAYLGDTTE